MNNKAIRTIMFLIAIVVGYIGFRFVTQAGQGLDAVQNDGYGGTGGFMILISGFILGVLSVNKSKEDKGK